MAEINKVPKTPYLPIDKFDPKQIQDLTKNEADVEKDTGVVDLNALLNELPSNASDLGRDVFSKEVATILYGMGMEKYYELFKAEDINLETFLQLNYNDLNQLGITNPDDQDKIIKNLKDIKSERSECFGDSQNTQYIVPANSYEDFVISKNILNQIIYLQSYGSYTILQMKKNELYDYFVSRNQTAVGVLKLLAEQALTQSNRISDILYDGNLEGNNLIATAVKISKKELPKSLEKKLVPNRPKPKVKTKKVMLTIMVVVGISSAAVLIGKQILQR